MKTPQEWNSVNEFATWFLNQRIIDFIPFMKPDSINFGAIGRAVLFRHDRFQVELWIIWPGETSFPEHEHPDVDTVEVHLCGKIQFTLDGEPVDSTRTLVLNDGKQISVIDIPKDQTHQASAGSEGAMFLSIQMWPEGVQPTSVALNWRGPEFSLVQSNLRQ
jgi:quercetin dioxygenase-like cupin family protein